MSSSEVNVPEVNKEQEGILLKLFPEQIVKPEASNVRPFSVRLGETDEEKAAIAELAESIRSNGQLQPVRVRPTNDPAVFELAMGRRRLDAVAYLNAHLQKGEEAKTIDAILLDPRTRSGGQNDAAFFRAAFVENHQRKGISDMDFAFDMKFLRDKFGWADAKGTKKLADWLGISPATITQKEKFLDFPEPVQIAIHQGQISAQQAFDLYDIGKAEGMDAAVNVLNLALTEGRAIESAAGGDEEEVVEVETTDGGTATVTGKKKAGTKKKAAKKKAAAAKSKVIKKAKRDLAGDEPPTAKKRTVKEIGEFFDGLLGPAYGHANGTIHRFLQKFQDYRAGTLSDRTFETYFEKMVEKADRGTPESAKTETAEGGKKAAKKKK